MKKAKNIFLSLSFLFLTIFLMAGNHSLILKSAQASSLWESQNGMAEIGDSFGESGDPEDIRYKVVKIINIVLSILGILLVVLIIYAGFLWMTAGGNEDQVSKAKKIMINAIIGLVLILFAWSITYFIMMRLNAINVGDPNYRNPNPMSY
jgi:heme/copper-type cytochrome/quinol oxidase subunit 2